MGSSVVPHPAAEWRRRDVFGATSANIVPPSRSRTPSAAIRRNFAPTPVYASLLGGLGVVLGGGLLVVGEGLVVLGEGLVVVVEEVLDFVVVGVTEIVTVFVGQLFEVHPPPV